MHANESRQERDGIPLIYDVLVVGAGLSGIGAAYWLQKRCPDKNFLILEARETLGGTWDLFRYPGIRSDSDMFTFGYRFRPWKDPQSLSDGPSILRYLRETAEEAGIDKQIRYRHRVIGADWSDAAACWTVDVASAEGPLQLKTRFLYMCSGYYSYEEAHRPPFEGEEQFRGPIVVPQFWPKDLDYTGKRVLVIGSGATAVTIVPSMAASAKQVTMVQRSPTYVMTLPNRNGSYLFLRKWISDRAAYRITRWKNLLLGMAMFRLSRAFPGFVKKLIVKEAEKQLPPGFEVQKHFSPRYNPWDQRLCVVPDGDLFAAIRSGKAAVITDEILRVTPGGLELKSGQHLDADLIVMATGLKVRLLGGAQLTVNGVTVNPNQLLVYRGMLIQDIPNFAIAFGYTNASWTLKTDLTANYLCKLLGYMDRKGKRMVVPRRSANVSDQPFLDFDAGYIQRARHILPRQGSRRPWRVYQNYFMDMMSTRFGSVSDKALEFR
jgi:monooxygenase